jgi:hypothetical protein
MPFIWRQKLFSLPAIFISALTVIVIMTPAANADQEPVPAGDLLAASIFYEYAIYFLPQPAKNPDQVLAHLLKGEKYDFKLLDEPNPEINSVSVRRIDGGVKAYPPPGPGSLKYSGKGLSSKEANRLQQTERVFILDFSYPVSFQRKGLIQSARLLRDIARVTGGIIWDEETRECFSIDRWEKARIEGFHEEIPAVSGHITIHAYKNGEFIRAISLGMSKMGLPDIEVSDFSWADNRSVGNLINLFAQQLLESGKIKKEGEFQLDIDNVQHDTIRTNLLNSLYENAEKKASLRIVKGIRDRGDPDNRIIEIVFNHFPGTDKREKINVMVSRLFGWKDSLTYVKHNEEILMASEQAKEKLPGIRNEIRAGLRPGEYYMVKAPFPTPAGDNEWMWVEVMAWEGTKIRGLLRNQPFNIPDLKAGMEVFVQQEEVFDYLHVLPDGTRQGNETGKLIEKYGR